jgi:hypothetical protein
MSNVSLLNAPSYRPHKPAGERWCVLIAGDIYLGKYGPAASHEAYRWFTAEYLARGGRLDDDHGDVIVMEVMAAYVAFARRYSARCAAPSNRCTR